jgi:hypothetical protein
MADETIQKLIDELNEKVEEIKPQLEHIKEIYTLLEGIKRHTGVSLNLPDLNWLIAKEERTQEVMISQQNKFAIRPDTFYGKEITDATEEYLKMIGHAIAFDEIYDSLTKGGAIIESKERLNTALTRAVRKFKKFKSESGDNFGLLSWYEQGEKRRRTKFTRGSENGEKQNQDAESMTLGVEENKQ